MNNYHLSALGALAILVVVGFGVDAAVDVAAEVNRIEKQLAGLKPPAELIDAILKQLQTQCKTNRTIDQSLLNNTVECMDKHFNNTQLTTEIKESIPEGKLDTVFHNMCIKWPLMKGCLSQFFSVIDDCWQKGDHVTKFIDGFVKFFCGDDNDGARIALFFAEGGLMCLEEQGDTVKKCMEAKGTITDEVKKLEEVNLNDLDEVTNTLSSFKPPAVPPKDEICTKIEETRECAGALHKCKDPTPENLITAMLIHVGKALHCEMKESSRRITSNTSSSAGGLVSYIMSISFVLGLAVRIFH